jgi:hypothetical protein
MSDWIDETIRRLEEAQEALRRTAEARQAQAAGDAAANAVFAAQLPAVMERLIQAIEADIRKFNTKFPKQGQKWLSTERIGENGIRVKRDDDPTFSLDVNLDKTGPAIYYRRMTPANANVVKQDDGYFFVSDINSFKLVYQGKDITFEAASEELLKPALISLYGF